MQTDDVTEKTPPIEFLTSGLDSLYATYAFDMSCGAIDFAELEYLKTLARDAPGDSDVERRIDDHGRGKW